MVVDEDEEGERWNNSHLDLLTCAPKPVQPFKLPRHVRRLGAVLGVVLVEERGRRVAGRHRFCRAEERARCGSFDLFLVDGSRLRKLCLSLSCCPSALFGRGAEESNAGRLSLRRGERGREPRSESERAKKERGTALLLRSKTKSEKKTSP